MKYFIRWQRETSCTVNKIIPEQATSMLIVYICLVSEHAVMQNRWKETDYHSEWISSINSGFVARCCAVTSYRAARSFAFVTVLLVLAVVNVTIFCGRKYRETNFIRNATVCLWTAASKGNLLVRKREDILQLSPRHSCYWSYYCVLCWPLTRWRTILQCIILS